MAKKTATTKKPPTSRPKKSATNKKASSKKPAAARKKAAAPQQKSASKAPAKKSPAKSHKPAGRVTATENRQREQHVSHTNRAAKRGREITRAGRDLCDRDDAGNWTALPPPADIDRRESCRFSLQLYCETYLPDFFDLDWSPAHLKVFEKAERAVLKGGLFALAMPRGSGKTTIAIAAVCWAISYGHRQSVVLFGATKESAVELMTIVKAILEGEDFPIFAADFPEISIPCAELEDKAIKTKGQLYQGKSTRMKWDADKVQLPRIPGSVSAGACIRTRGLGGHMRGMIHRIGGRIIRPDLVILDDPQTDESAMSPEETKKRYKTIDKGVRGLAGPGKRIAGIMPCTVIEQNDLADKILTGAPGWKSERIPALTDFAGIPEESIELWEQYREIFVQEMNGEEYPLSNAFYTKHQKKLDATISHYWPERIEEGYVSAIQHAISWYLTRPESFWSEFMQKPEGEADPDADLLTIDEIKEKKHQQTMRVVPNDADVITAFVDVQHSVFYWCVIAFNKKNYNAYILDYGAWPDQKTRNFKLSQVRRKLQNEYKGKRNAKLGLHNVIRQGMNDCLKFLHDMEFHSQDERLMKIQRIGVDCRDGELTNELRDIIAAFDSPIKSSKFGSSPTCRTTGRLSHIDYGPPTPASLVRCLSSRIRRIFIRPSPSISVPRKERRSRYGHRKAPRNTTSGIVPPVMTTTGLTQQSAVSYWPLTKAASSGTVLQVGQNQNARACRSGNASDWSGPHETPQPRRTPAPPTCWGRQPPTWPASRFAAS